MTNHSPADTTHKCSLKQHSYRFVAAVQLLRTAEERTAEERTAEERTAEERTAGERTAGERTAEEGIAGEEEEGSEKCIRVRRLEEALALHT
jgi:hypothetical protein